MLERYLSAVHTEDPGAEEPAATRERLKERFPKNATRRMTQLGLLVGAALEPLSPGEDDTIVYASGYAETRALEGYLDSFPGASPTSFQTSIHPSAVQQALIARQQAVRQFFPMTGSAYLPGRALQVALLADTPRVILCGGEERGTWLLEQKAASDRTFAFACALTRDPARALAQVTLASVPASDRVDASSRHSGFSADATQTDAPEALLLPAFFDRLHRRESFTATVAPGLRLAITWL